MEKFVFTGIVFQEDECYISLCPELDIASQGETTEEAKDMLLEAAELYLAGAIEDGLPYYRPIPPAEDPRYDDSVSVSEIFQLKVDVAVRAYV